MITRREMLQCSGSALIAATLPASLEAAGLPSNDFLTNERPPVSERHFTSDAIEEAIVRTKKSIADPELGRLFENCLANTLDTTVFLGEFEGKPDTFVITGDIDAMWLRDSSAQLMPYLPYTKQDRRLATLMEGAIRRQTRQILLDPYANAFLRNPTDKFFPGPSTTGPTCGPAWESASGKSIPSATRSAWRITTGRSRAAPRLLTHSGSNR